MVFANPLGISEPSISIATGKRRLTGRARLDADSADLRGFAHAITNSFCITDGATRRSRPAHHRLLQRDRGNDGSSEAASFIRLLFPGMQHCAGGSGATAFGQQAPGAAGDPEHNISAALERWVEQDSAPGPIVASKTSVGNVAGMRPLCPYPKTAHYKGAGSTENAESFVCR